MPTDFSSRRHSPARHARVTIGETRDQAVIHSLPDIACAYDDALGVVIAKPKDRLGEVIWIFHINLQRRQVEVALHFENRPVAAMHLNVGRAAVDDGGGQFLAAVHNFH